MKRKFKGRAPPSSFSLFLSSSLSQFRDPTAAKSHFFHHLANPTISSLEASVLQMLIIKLQSKATYKSTNLDVSKLPPRGRQGPKLRSKTANIRESLFFLEKFLRSETSQDHSETLFKIESSLISIIYNKSCTFASSIGTFKDISTNFQVEPANLF